MSEEIFDPLPIINAPDSVTVEKHEPKPVLYRADGTPLIRDARIGFRTVKR